MFVKHVLPALSAATVAVALAFGAPALAQTKTDTMSKDSMSKDGMKKDTMSKDGMAKGTMSKDSMAKDGMSKDNMKR